MKPRLFITGGSSLLALNWAVAVRDRYTVILGQHNRVTRLAGVQTRPMNLESAASAVSLLEDIQPNAVVHTAGITSVEKCESDTMLADHINVDIAENVAKACAALGVPMVHISTDHLFSGDHAFVDERAQVLPVNAYAKSKAKAEVRVLQAWPEALIVRTNFFGWGPSYRQSFSDAIINSLRAGQPMHMFQDVHFTPIIATELAQAAHDLIDTKAAGIFNVVGDDRISKYEFGLMVARQFNLDLRLIVPDLLANRTSLALRPLEMSLSNQKIHRHLGRSMGSVADHLRLLHAQETSGIAKEIGSL